MKKLSFIITLCSFIILLSNTIFAKGETEVLIIGQSLNNSVYSSNTEEGDFLLPLVETAKILGADVHYEGNQNKVSIILMNFPTSGQTYKTKYVF